jgi:hypothetical protein
MATYNPFEGSFEHAKNLDNYANLSLWLSTIMLGVAFSIKSYNSQFSNVSDFIINLNCFFIIAFAVLNFIAEYIFYNASIKRRSDFIDNSFESSLSEYRSIEYYTNENIANGVYKMAVNGFENSLFTYHISKSMMKSKWLKNIIFAFLILLFAIFGFNNAFILLIQLSLPLLLFQQAVKHTLFVSRISRVYENYRRLFNDLKNNPDSKNKRPEIILNVLDYETTLTYGAILLDTNTYNKLNPALSEKWNRIKLEYNIE